MKPTKILSLLTTLLLLFSACSGNSDNNTTTPKQEVDKINEYISFTVSYLASYDEVNDNAKYGAAVYEYDLQSREIAEIFNFPLNTQYALGVYDKKTNSVYYSKEKNNNSYERQGKGDQIYVYNLVTASDTMLTDDLLAVNYIIPVDGNLFFLAARQNNPNLILGKIDLSDGNITYWDEEKTTASRILSIDRIQRRIYVAIYDSDEERIAIEAHYKTADAVLIPVTHTIYSYNYDLSDKQEVLSKTNMRIKAVYAMDNRLMYRVDDTVSSYPDTTTTSEVIDLSNMEVLLLSEEPFSEGGSFTLDMKGVYVLDNIGENIGICYYDFEMQEYTPVVAYNFGNNYFGIANFQLIHE